MENFTAPALIAPALLPTAFAQAMTESRPLRDPGDPPRATVILLEIDVQGLGA